MISWNELALKRFRSRKDVQKELETATTSDIYEASIELSFHALEHAWQVEKNGLNNRLAIIHIHNALELLFKSKIVDKMKKQRNIKVQLPSAAEMIRKEYQYIQQNLGHYVLLHEYRNLAYHIGDAAPDKRVAWAVQLLIETYKHINDRDLMNEFYSGFINQRER